MRGFLSILCRAIFIVFWLLLADSSVLAQSKYPQNDFVSPVEIPLYLAGNFAELRNNHFHGGLDVKTNGVEGLKVLSVANGYVSRIKVSPFGYGKALYIRHPNGYTTVYGHLQKFSDEIEAFVKKAQYKKQSFSVELFPMASDLPVKQGEMVAISGNTGGSSAPHLHFEVRETASEDPVNPLLFGFNIKDHIPPVISRIYVYPLSQESQINFGSGRKSFSVLGQNGKFYLSSKSAIEVYGDFGFGISLYDQLDEIYNMCGIYEIRLFKNESMVYYQKMEKVGFHENRYINAMCDYEEKVKSGRWIVRNFLLPNNKLSVYVKHENRGVINLKKGEHAKIRYEITDVHGNISELSFDVIGTEPVQQARSVLSEKPARRFSCNQANSFEAEDVMVYFPANVLYEDLDFTFYKDDALPRTLTPVYHIHNIYTPLHTYYALSIKAGHIDQSIRKYCTVVSLNNGGGALYEGGYWKGDYLIVKTRSFGAFSVMVDSTPPVLTPVNIFQNANMSRKWSITVKAEDNLSGVNTFDSYIDGKWVLTEFDYKNKRLIHYFDELPPGNHHYELVVKDKIGNTAKYEADFVR